MESALSCAVSKIRELLQEDFLSSGLSNQIDQVKIQLDQMRCFLRDVVTIRKNDEKVKNWGKHLVEVAYETEDVTDTFLYEIRQSRDKATVGVLKKIAQKPIQVYAERNLRNKITEIQTKLEMIFHTRMALNLIEEERELRLCEEGSGFDDCNHKIVGFDNAMRTVIDQLLTGNSGQQQRHVVSIVGMGGAGKSALAKMVYKSKEVKEYFEITLWLTITDNFNLVNILNNWFEEIGTSVPIEWNHNVDFLLEEMSEVLKEKKYLIVLDDVWREDLLVLFAKALPDVGNGSRVLMTTRMLNVAQQADPAMKPYLIPLLDTEESLQLLLSRAFRYENATASCFSDKLDKMAKELSCCCGGLPLALVAVGGFLSLRDKTYSSWNRLFQTLDSQLSGSECFKVLAKSYDYLPYYLKPCFLYFALFPENSLIKANSLRRIWIAEGFVQYKENLSLEDASENYLEDLAQRCLVEVPERSIHGTIKLCRVHGLLRKLAISKAIEENFLQGQPQQNNREQFPARRAAYIQNAAVHSGSNNYLRSLFVFDVIDIHSQVEFRLLRVLELHKVRYHDNNFPVETMVHLRYLGLRDSGICSLPKNIGCLKNLQTLDIRFTDLASVPVSLWSITTLRHVLASKPINGPSNQSTLKNLQTLKDIQIMDWQKGLPCMENIRKLGLWNSEERDSQPTVEMLQNLEHLLSLSLNCKVLPAKIVDMRPFRSYGLIQSLKLQGDWPQNLPLRVAMFPLHVSKLVLDNTRLEQDPIPELRWLQTIKVLYLSRDAIICKKMNCFSGGFPLLEKLHLLSINSLEEFYVGDGSLIVLKFLRIKECNKLNVLPDLHHVTTLQELDLASASHELLQRTTKQDGADWHKIKHITSLKRKYTALSLRWETIPNWTPDEIILFEMALAKYDKGTPDRWQNIARMMGSKRSAREVKWHYEFNLVDKKNVEDNAGKFAGKDAAYMANSGICINLSCSRPTSSVGGVRFCLPTSAVLNIQKGDLTVWSVNGSNDAIVNSTNESLLGAGLVGAAIHDASGPELFEACKKVVEVRPNVRCPTGEARITPAFCLPVAYVIHTVGPFYITHKHPDIALKNAYKSCLEIAKKNNVWHIAFPAISCGAYRFPHKEASRIAISVLKEFSDGLKEVHIVLFTGEFYDTWVTTAQELL